MKELEIFYLNGCPYCRNAQKAAAQLQAENPAFAALPVRWIEERENAALAQQRDYYYVPTIFCGEEKLYEASPADDYAAILNHFRSAFQRALD